MSTFKDRLIQEGVDLSTKYVGITTYLAKPQPIDCDDQQWELLKQQATAMLQYLSILETRIYLLNKKGDEPVDQV